MVKMGMLFMLKTMCELMMTVMVDQTINQNGSLKPGSGLSCGPDSPCDPGRPGALVALVALHLLALVGPEGGIAGHPLEVLLRLTANLSLSSCGEMMLLEGHG